MKKSGIIVASMAAASASAISASSPSSSSSSSDFFCNSKIQPFREGGVPSKERDNSSSSEGPASTDKFAPRFDGLRFIETLVTAHR